MRLGTVSYHADLFAGLLCCGALCAMAMMEGPWFGRVEWTIWLMIGVVLSPEEKAQVEQARRTRPQIAERCHYVLLNAEGWSVPHIAQRFDRNEHTIRTRLKAYQTAGLPGLQHTPQPGRPATKGQEVTAQLEHLFVQRPSPFGSMEEGWTVDLIRHYLAQKTSDVSDSTVRRPLQAGGWV